MRFITKILAIIAFILPLDKAYAQDISNLTEQKPFDYSGSMNLNQSAQLRNTEYAKSNPYSILLSGNASFSIYGIAFPFSFSYSNQQVNYSQPFSFNQFGMQPSYKWVKTYVGYNTMSFSPYSLNGHQFLGGGVELTPNIGLKVSMMYGRLVKGVEWDQSKPTMLPYYERYGYATKVGYSGKIGNLDISLFKAKDKQNSITGLPDSLNITPQENMVYTINFGNTFFEKLKISGEVAGSALTTDIRQDSNEYISSKKVYFLISPNGTTTYSHALKGSVDYLGTGYSVGVAYERVEPTYSTLGAYYTNNDLENIALTFSKQLLEGKINISGSAGNQRNNLDKSKVSTSTNFLGSINLSYAPSQRYSITTSYSNYSYYTYMRNPFDQINQTTPYEFIDTLNFTQISQSGMLNSNVILGSLDNKDKRQMLMTNISVQQSANRQEGVGILNSSYFYQGNLTYSYSLTPKQLSITSTLMGSFNRIPGVENRLTTGPVIGVSKSFFDKKLTTSTSIAYNISMKDNDRTGDVISVRIGGGYTHQKVHKVSFNFAVVNKNSKTEIAKTNSFEFTGSLNYTYSFSKQ